MLSPGITMKPRSRCYDCIVLINKTLTLGSRNFFKALCDVGCKIIIHASESLSGAVQISPNAVVDKGSFINQGEGGCQMSIYVTTYT